jgi:hypothetical protein
MATIRLTCRPCGAAVLLSPPQVLLLHTGSDTSDAYVFFCPSCARGTVNSAGPAETLLLLAAGVAVGGGDGRAAADFSTNLFHPPGKAPPFTPDDILTFHLLLAGEDWLPRLVDMGARRDGESPRRKGEQQ